MKFRMLALVCGCLLMAGQAIAQDAAAVCPGKCPADSSAKCCAAKCCAAKTSTVATVADEKAVANCTATCSLPQMAFMVGEQKTCCAGSAAALAAEKKLPIKYVVATKSFDTEEAAFVSLVETTEKFVNDFATPVKCEQSGLTTIAGKACACPVMAGEREKLVKASMEKVHMTYKVGKEACDCPVTAKSKAEAAGEKVAYVVNGEETHCEDSARLNLARAKYNAAVAALQPKVESTADASDAPKIN